MLTKPLQKLLENINGCRMEMNLILTIDQRIKSLVDTHLVGCIDVILAEILKQEDKK